MRSDSLAFFFTILTNMLLHCGGHQGLPPGVNPQHYQQAGGHQMPQMQQVPGQQHGVPMQQVPMQQQQMHMQQQQMHMQQPQMHMQQQQMHMPQQQMPMQQQQQQPMGHGHAHHGQPPVLNVANIQQEKQHIAEHLSVPMDTSKMTEQELQFHYFKMHDSDNNNKLDGCELIKSLIHWHGDNSEAEPKPDDVLAEMVDEVLTSGDMDNDGDNMDKQQVHSDESLAELVDEVFKSVDLNNDGFLSYSEFKTY